MAIQVFMMRTAYWTLTAVKPIQIQFFDHQVFPIGDFLSAARYIQQLLTTPLGGFGRPIVAGLVT
ncbi:hypothetical protein [Brevundimonas sp.]|uniref:hypothetical protein n=1 Tax=Brevundimonas sp. TaxID=1871086 RepID=UPI002ABB77B4|nr:hypothetical protein [Brevundimonas sp.]MDZ4362563.1 hypothetical protein [Brevundimonas sp.]